MNSDEIREVVEKAKHLHTLFAKTRTGRETISDDFYWIEPLVSLAEKYLAVEARMPSKHPRPGGFVKVCDITHCEDEVKGYFNGYNEAIDDCTLIFTKLLTK